MSGMFYRHDFLESRVKAFASYPDVVAVFSDHEICDGIGFVSSGSNNKKNRHSCKLTEKALLEYVNSLYIT